ncbi:DUF2878 domain-containing protein, partial [Aeromonas hydrophila]|uniref:DUF2878 domain-containing protein n=2 Tax=Aeromonadaceae TaxID=84642 RepID=UPI0004496D32
FLFSPRRWHDWRLIPVALAGSLLDALLWQLGLFYFNTGFPLWLVLLWCGFALTLSHGLRWLRPLPRWQQGLFGMVGGASSYVAGAAMGAVHLPWGIGISAALLAVIWMWWLPVLLWVTVKLEGEAR